VIQVPLRYRRLGDEGNELKLAPARTGEDVHGEDLLEEVGRNDPDFESETGVFRQLPPTSEEACQAACAPSRGSRPAPRRGWAGVDLDVPIDIAATESAAPPRLSFLIPASHVRSTWSPGSSDWTRGRIPCSWIR
jgi:hypothetical protein